MGWGQGSEAKSQGVVSPFDELTLGEGGGSPDDLDEGERKHREEQRRQLETRKKIEQQEQKTIGIADQLCNGCGDYVERQISSDYYRSLSDTEKQLYLTNIYRSLESGGMGKDDLEGLTKFTDKWKADGSSSIYLVNMTTFIPNPFLVAPVYGKYAGDDRDLWQYGSYRTTHSVVFDAANGEILADFSDTGITEKLELWPSWARTPVIDRRTAPVGDKGGFAEESSGSQITMSGDSMNPFIFNPVCQGCLLDNSIDYRVTFNLSGGKVNNIDVFHDGFPGYELRVNGQHTYGYSPATPGDREGPFQLFGGLDVHKRINCDRNRPSKC